METLKKDIMMKTDNSNHNLSPSNYKPSSALPVVGKVKKILPSSTVKPIKPKIMLKLQIPKDDSANGSRTETSSQNALTDEEVSKTYDFCDKESENHVKKKHVYVFKLLSHHIVKRKQGAKMYRCDVCCATYRHVFSLKRHFLRNHVNYKYLSEADISNCKINFSPDDEHPEVDKAGNSVFKPEQNENKAKLPETATYELQGHEKISDLFRCHRCLDLKFDSLISLNQHFETHQGSTKAQFSCDNCDAVFAQRLAFIRHKASHTNKKQFVCSSCGLNFVSRPSYIKHISTHSNGKACNHCGKVFSTSANRKRHERLHEGLKPYPCRHCSMGFTQNNDLKCHVKELHRDLYFECSQCPKLVPSEESLRKHLAEKHSVPPLTVRMELGSPKAARPLIAPQSALKTIQPSSLNQIMPKQKSVSKSVPITSPHALPAKMFSCSFCKKMFRSYLHMVKHKNQSHPFLHVKRRQHRKQLKLNSAGPILKRKVLSSTRSRELTEQEFFSCLSDQIADNLINFVDGKSPQLALKQSEIMQSSEPAIENSLVNMSESWSSYNFPKDFDMQQCSQQGKCLIPNSSMDSNFTDNQPVAQCSSKFIEVPTPGKLTGMVLLGNDPTIDYSEDSHSVDGEVVDEQCPEMSLEERKALIGREVPVSYVCCVCMDNFESLQLYEDHQANNHPNVLSSHIEIEGTKECQPVVPPDICKQFISPVGLLNHCRVPPSLADQSDLICTKCKLKFPCVSDLHTHIIECGGNESTVPTFIYRKHQRRIKRTMKNRIDTTVRHAYFVKKRVKVPNGNSKIPNENSNKTFFTANTSLLLPQSAKKNYGNDFLKKLPQETEQDFTKEVKETKYACSVCKSSFKTKNILKAHVIRCRKGIPGETGNSHSDGIVCAAQSSVLSPTIDVAAKSDRENERHGASSPSLECLVDSIKQKLTSDDMSSSHSSSSWMDEEPPDISLEKKSLSSSSTLLPEEVNSTNTRQHCETTGVETPSREDAFHERDVTSPDMDLPILVEESKSGPEMINSSDTVISALDITKINGEKIVTEEHEPHNSDSASHMLGEDSVTSDVEFPDEKELDSSRAACDISENVSVGNDAKDCKIKTEDNVGTSYKHLCPFCLGKFSYLIPYRKHIKMCKLKGNKEEETAGKPTNLLHLPNKDEVEASMINLLRHQSRQNEMMKEAESKAASSTGSSKKFQSYTCDLCHKIFLCYFKMLQHRVSHKLNSEELKMALQSEGNESKQNALQSEGNESKQNTLQSEGSESKQNTLQSEGSESKQNTLQSEGSESKQNAQQSDGSESKQKLSSDDNSAKVDNASSSTEVLSTPPSVGEVVNSDVCEVQQNETQGEGKLLCETSEPTEIVSNADLTKSASSPRNLSRSHPDDVPARETSKRKKNLPPTEEIKVKRKKISNESPNSVSIKVPGGISSPNAVLNKLGGDKCTNPESGSRSGIQDKPAKRKPQAHSSVSKMESTVNTSGVSDASHSSPSKSSKRKLQEDSAVSKAENTSKASDASDTARTENSVQTTKNKLRSDTSASKPGTSSNSVDANATQGEFSSDDLTCPLCEKVFTAPFYKNRHVKHMHRVKDEKLKPSEEQKKGKLATKVSKKNFVPKNSRRAFQRQCKKPAIAAKSAGSSKQNSSKKSPTLRKSPPKKKAFVSKKRSTRS